MRYAIVSDIHSNWEALSAVFADIDSIGVDAVLCLGDTIGYGANPNECLDLIRERCSAVIAGNHDWAAIGLTSTEYFNPFARQSASWTAGALRADHGEYIRTLPLSAVVEDMLLVHSTPIVPEEWRYVLNSMDAAAELAAIDEPIAFIGHSHLPAVFERELSCALHSLQCGLVKLAAAGVVALGGFEDLAPAGACGDYGFRARHLRILLEPWQATPFGAPPERFRSIGCSTGSLRKA